MGKHGCLKEEVEQTNSNDTALGKFLITQKVLIFRSTIPKLKEYIGSMLCAFKISSRDKNTITDLCSPIR